MSDLARPAAAAGTDPARQAVVLESRGLCVGYGGRAFVRELDLTVCRGEVVAVLGPNGAGKTTTLLGLSGALPALSGEVRLNGVVTTAPLSRRAHTGLALITEDRSVFGSLTVADNLKVGRCDQNYALELFPELKPLLRRRASLLSGGEQQMLTLGRALARRPGLLIVDELSMGLAPLVVRRLMDVVRTAADEGAAVLLVEQHVRQVLRVADRVYTLVGGEVTSRLTGAQARADVAALEREYLFVRTEGAE